MGWIILACAGIAEVGFTTFMKLSDGFKHWKPSVAFMVSLALSMGLLSVSLNYIPLGTAYAVWTGIGAVGTTLIGILVFKESASLARLLCLTVLIMAIIGLKVVS